MDPASQTNAAYAVETPERILCAPVPFPRLSDPRKVARQCQLTLALPLRGSLVISVAIPSRGFCTPGFL